VALKAALVPLAVASMFFTLASTTLAAFVLAFFVTVATATVLAPLFTTLFPATAHFATADTLWATLFFAFTWNLSPAAVTRAVATTVVTTLSTEQFS